MAVLPGLDIFYVGYGDWHSWSWDGFRTRSAQLCRFLSRSPHVRRVFVLSDTVFLTKTMPGFCLPNAQRFRLLPIRSDCRQVEEKVYLLNPSRFLLGSNAMKRPYIERMVRRHLGRNAKHPVLWVCNVHKAYLMESVPASLRIFDAIDDWESVMTYQRYKQSIRRGYELILRKADVIYTVSKQLEERFRERARTRHVYHLPNGVDVELFQPAAAQPSLRRAGRRGEPPVLTYVGVLSERFDIDLIEQVARDWPTCRIRLVGPVTRMIEERRRTVGRLSNVEWTGMVNHREVPGILVSSDVLLIPHRVSALSLSMDPLKLYEYLTTGLPIVSTPVPPTEEFARFLYLGAGESFSRKVGEALEEVQRQDADAIWKSRIEEAKRHSWVRRTERILSDMLALARHP